MQCNSCACLGLPAPGNLEKRNLVLNSEPNQPSSKEHKQTSAEMRKDGIRDTDTDTGEAGGHTDW